MNEPMARYVDDEKFDWDGYFFYCLFVVVIGLVVGFVWGIL